MHGSMYVPVDVDYEFTQEQVQFQKSFMNLHTIPHTFTSIWLIARVYTFDTTILIC